MWAHVCKLKGHINPGKFNSVLQRVAQNRVSTFNYCTVLKTIYLFDLKLP